MGQIAQNHRAKTARISIDWMVLSVAIFALTLLLLTLPRGNAAERTLALGGLQTLEPNDAVLAFQDFSFGAEGWTPDATEDRLAGLGPVLGRFMDETLERTIIVPEGTANVIVQLDLHLAGAWTPDSAIVIAVDGTEAVRIPWPDTDAAADVFTASAQGLRADVSAFEITPRRPDTALPGPTPALASFAVSLSIAAAPGDLTLSFAPAMPPDRVGATWAIDNFSAVARAAQD